MVDHARQTPHCACPWVTQSRRRPQRSVWHGRQRLRRRRRTPRLRPAIGINSRPSAMPYDFLQCPASPAPKPSNSRFPAFFLHSPSCIVTPCECYGRVQGGRSTSRGSAVAASPLVHPGPTPCAQARFHGVLHDSPGLITRRGKHKYFLVFTGHFRLFNTRRSMLRCHCRRVTYT
jgi:hypothetical protein